jgi:outer membrane protein assembly factor BamB
MKQRIGIGVAVALGAVVVSIFGGGCGTVLPLLGRSEHTNIVPVPAQSFKRQWTAKLAMAEDRPAAIFARGETVFVYSQNNTAYAINSASGEILHLNVVAAEGVKLRPPVVLPDSVVFPTNSTFEVYDLKGKKRTSIDMEVALRSNVVGEGRLLFVSADYLHGRGRLVEADVTKPLSPTVWELATSAAASSTPVLHAGTIYFASEDGRVYAVTTERKPIWPLEGNAFATAGAVVADLAADDYGVYVASTDSKLYCLDRMTGKIKWQYYAGQSLVDGPVITGSLVYQLVPSVGMVAIQKSSGKYNREPAWTVPDARQFLSEDGKYAYLLRKDGVIIAVDKQTGATQFTSKPTTFTAFATNTKDSMIYATGGDEAVAITPVLHGGSVGEIVLQPVRPRETLAAAN